MFNTFSKYIQGNIFFMMIKIYFKNAIIIQNAMWESVRSKVVLVTTVTQQQPFNK